MSLPIACLLAACGGIYYKPETTSIATVRFTNASSYGPAGAGIYDNPHCIGGKAVSFDAIPSGKSVDVATDAGRLLTFVVDGDRGSDIRIGLPGGSGVPYVTKAEIKRCQAPGRFLPAIGGKYEVVYTDYGSRCEVEVFDIASGQRKVLPHEKLRWGPVSAGNPKASCAPAAG